jgi:hypothetical protein
MKQLILVVTFILALEVNEIPIRPMEEIYKSLPDT